MDLSNLEILFEEARKLTGHTEFVVVGSLSVLGIVQGRRVPPQMLMSIDVDCFTRQEPERIFELQRALGEGSAFEAAHGYYLDPVSPNLPTLPAQLSRAGCETQRFSTTRSAKKPSARSPKIGRGNLPSSLIGHPLTGVPSCLAMFLSSSSTSTPGACSRVAWRR
jgi:hypothetical protein